MRRWGILLILALVAAAFVGVGYWAFRETRPPIVVGILHSQTGAMAISEQPMIDAEVLALEQINARGGLLGRPVRWVIADGRSDWPTFSQQAERLIREEKVSVIFGCWTSASRKSVKPVVERADHLLIYPMAYEGLEQSPNIVYTGGSANQQVIPAVKWCYDALRARRFFLVGSDYIWPHAVNEIVKDQLRGLGGSLAGERYIAFGGTDVGGAVTEIKEARPDVVLSTIAGDTNLAFYEQMKRSGLGPDRVPVVSFSVAEEELRKMPSRDVVAGAYAAWNYFQSLERPENREFVGAFRARYGEDRVTSDVMAASYNSVGLWAQAVEEAGTEEVRAVRKAILRQSLDAPEGIVSVDGETQHTWRPFYVGKARADGQFDVIWSIPKPVRPVPYPITRSKSAWEAFLADLYQRWGGRWANPVAPGAAPTP